MFRNSAQPQYCVSFELDITNFLTKIRERGYSFTFAFVYAVSKCANEIEEFRYRFHEGKPVIYEKVNTSFTYLEQETELFKVVNVEMQDTMEAVSYTHLEVYKRQITAYLQSQIATWPKTIVLYPAFLFFTTIMDSVRREDVAYSITLFLTCMVVLFVLLAVLRSTSARINMEDKERARCV